MCSSRRGILRTPLLISLKQVRHLSGVTVVGDWIHIGSLTPVEDLVRSEVLKRKSPLLPLAAVQLGSRQIRNMATLGGNLCNASPAGDLSTALLCLDTELKMEGLEGARSEKLVDFFRGPGLTSLSPGEVMTGILVPSMEKGWVWSYQKLGARRAMEIGIVNVALGLKLEAGCLQGGADRPRFGGSDSHSRTKGRETDGRGNPSSGPDRRGRRAQRPGVRPHRRSQGQPGLPQRKWLSTWCGEVFAHFRRLPLQRNEKP